CDQKIQVDEGDILDEVRVNYPKGKGEGERRQNRQDGPMRAKFAGVRIEGMTVRTRTHRVAPSVELLSGARKANKSTIHVYVVSNVAATTGLGPKNWFTVG